MRRIAVIATALFVLGAAGAAYAATQQYTGSIAVSPSKPGTVKKPVAAKYTLTIKAKPSGTSRPSIQLDVRTKIYGLRVDGKDFPTCSLTKIANAKNDNVCPRGAEVATGYIQSTLGSPDFQTPGQACDPVLDVWNGGQGKLTFFFVTNPSHMCLGGAIKTGSTAPYPGTYKEQGGYLVSDTPVPAYIDYPLGVNGGVVGSLEYEHLVFKTQSKKVKGKTVYSQYSVGCLKGKRPYQISNTTTGGPSGPGKVVSTVSAKGPC